MAVVATSIHVTVNVPTVSVVTVTKHVVVLYKNLNAVKCIPLVLARFVFVKRLSVIVSLLRRAANKLVNAAA
jgi:hypothetical protein